MKVPTLTSFLTDNLSEPLRPTEKANYHTKMHKFVHCCLLFFKEHGINWREEKVED
jgi:hypothetical protein